VAEETTLAGIAGAGVVGGLVLLGRGFVGHRAAGRISGTSPSRIASLAIGEVLVTGTVEPIELTLVSPLQSRACVWYRARVTESRDDEDGGDVLREERAVGFRIRDDTGSLRVFPHGARFDVPDRFDETTSAWSGSPAGLHLRTGSAFGPGPDDHATQVAALLTVRDPAAEPVLGGRGGALAGGTASRHYREARLEAGDVVTAVGRVLPFSELEDPVTANRSDGAGLGADPEIAADLAEARAAGILAATPEEAWGNAAIPGFGIGRPVRPPELDPAADPPQPPEPGQAARAAAAFEIAPDALVLAASDEVPLQVAFGAPSAVSARGEWQFVIGLVGAALAIASAMALALLVDGGLR
jgi:hypothetical protein